MRIFAAGCVMAMCAAAGLAGEFQQARWVPGSTEVLMQLTGEKFQYFADGKRFVCDTHNRTLTSHGLDGTDLGIPVAFPGRTLLLFGDSWGYWKNDAGDWVWHPGWGKADSIGYFDGTLKLEDCAEYSRFEKQVSSGIKDPRLDHAGSPLLKFFVKPRPKAKEPLFYETAIKNLTPGQNVGSFEVPTGAFALNGRLYVFYNVKHQEGLKPDGKRVVYFLNSVLARSEETCDAWKSDAPPALTRLYDVSSHEPLADVNNPPEEGNAAGKFIHVAPVVMEAETLKKAGLDLHLPASLRTAKKVVLMWGSSWKYVHSNLYLAAVSAEDIEATVNGGRDPSKWWYFSGDASVPAWTNDETAATPLLNSWRPDGAPCIGEHSVVWNEALGQFVLAYQDRYIAIKLRTSRTPWGQWSKEACVFSRSEDGRNFIHHKDKDTITQNITPKLKPNGQPFNPPDNWGACYGPYMFDESTINVDGSVTLYFTMSTWTPYNVFLMKTTLSAK